MLKCLVPVVLVVAIGCGVEVAPDIADEIACSGVRAFTCSCDPVYCDLGEAGGDGGTGGQTAVRECDGRGACPSGESCLHSQDDTSTCVSTTEFGQLVECDTVEIETRSGTTYREEKVIIPAVEPWTALITFCDVYNIIDGEPGGPLHECVESRQPRPGRYLDGDLHLVCNDLTSEDDGRSWESGVGRLYVRFDDGVPADRNVCHAVCEECHVGYVDHCVEDCVELHEAGTIFAPDFSCGARKRVYFDVDAPSAHCLGAGAGCPIELSREGQSIFWEVDFDKRRSPLRVEVGGAVTYQDGVAVHFESQWVVEDVTDEASLGYQTAHVPIGHYDADTGNGVSYTFIALYFD